MADTLPDVPPHLLVALRHIHANNLRAVTLAEERALRSLGLICADHHAPTESGKAVLEKHTPVVFVDGTVGVATLDRTGEEVKSFSVTRAGLRKLSGHPSITSAVEAMNREIRIAELANALATSAAIPVTFGDGSRGVVVPTRGEDGGPPLFVAQQHGEDITPVHMSVDAAVDDATRRLRLRREEMKAASPKLATAGAAMVESLDAMTLSAAVAAHNRGDITLVTCTDGDGGPYRPTLRVSDDGEPDPEPAAGQGEEVAILTPATQPPRTYEEALRAICHGATLGIGAEALADVARAALGRPATENERTQAERWAEAFMGPAVWPHLRADDCAAAAEDMLPLVREARAEIEEAHRALDPIVTRRDTVNGPPLSLVVRARTAATIAREARATAEVASRPAPLDERDAVTRVLAALGIPADAAESGALRVATLHDLAANIAKVQAPDATPTPLTEAETYGWANQALAPLYRANVEIHVIQQATDLVASAVREAWANRRLSRGEIPADVRTRDVRATARALDAIAGLDASDALGLRVAPADKRPPAPAAEPNLAPEEIAELIASAPGHLGLTTETAEMMQRWRSAAARRAAGEPGHGMAEPLQVCPECHMAGQCKLQCGRRANQQVRLSMRLQPATTLDVAPPLNSFGAPHVPDCLPPEPCICPTTPPTTLRVYCASNGHAAVVLGATGPWADRQLDAWQRDLTPPGAGMWTWEGIAEHEPDVLVGGWDFRGTWTKAMDAVSVAIEPIANGGVMVRTTHE